MTGSDIFAMLKNRGVISNQLFFKLATKLSGSGNSFMVGVYELSPKMSYEEIIEKLSSYSTAGLVKITVPEGYRLIDIAQLLEENDLCTKEEFFEEVANGSFSYSFLKNNTATGKTRLEGFLFPDTYLVDEKETAYQIIDKMLFRFDELYTEELDKKAKELGFSTQEIITLASIIEKEGSSQLETISSVFHNRLKTGMRLESCATVNYLFDKPKDVLSIQDTHIQSPYNTYRNDGLPPTPICSPGLSAIKAAIYPENTQYLYFIADGKGGNLFSVTYEEHLSKKGK